MKRRYSIYGKRRLIELRVTVIIGLCMNTVLAYELVYFRQYYFAVFFGSLALFFLWFMIQSFTSIVIIKGDRIVRRILWRKKEVKIADIKILGLLVENGRSYAGRYSYAPLKRSEVKKFSKKRDIMIFVSDKSEKELSYYLGVETIKFGYQDQLYEDLLNLLVKDNPIFRQWKEDKLNEANIVQSDLVPQNITPTTMDILFSMEDVMKRIEHYSGTLEKFDLKTGSPFYNNGVVIDNSFLKLLINNKVASKGWVISESTDYGAFTLYEFRKG